MSDFRQIPVDFIRDTVKTLCLKANRRLPYWIEKAYKRYIADEENTPLARNLLSILLKNSRVARHTGAPLCQDTGIVMVFMQVGQQVLFTNGDLNKAIDAGVFEAYKAASFRMSVVEDPILRNNNFRNTPAQKHISFISGQKVKITVLIKGGGSENATKLSMFNPTATLQEIEDFVVEHIRSVGSTACPPYVIGLGLGGTSEEAILLSKKAIFMPQSRRKYVDALRQNLIKRLNSLKIGPAGFGGYPTVLDVRVRMAPTHIATLPVAITVQCNSVRYASKIV